MLNELKTLTPTPLIPITQKELHSKWLPSLPKGDGETTCPKTLDEIIELVKEKIKEKSRSKLENKKIVKV